MIYIISASSFTAKDLARQLMIPRGMWCHIGEPRQMQGLRGARYLVAPPFFEKEEGDYMNELIKVLEWKPVWE